MKKVILNPLELDKETIAQLDEAQLQQVVGGNGGNTGVQSPATSTGCGSGSSTC
ncbi:class I lanthipeptide [Chitinophaga vietnamensis]|uniref:class I lanthipeptide n=1 Tax=Chitinophaga vietnamensis TaxID=2593957 RepID=UPI0013758780|nr:class I lanthipeptide [Chitinophaga vietnamensis]